MFELSALKRKTFKIWYIKGKIHTILKWKRTDSDHVFSWQNVVWNKLKVLLATRKIYIKRNEDEQLIKSHRFQLNKRGNTAISVWNFQNEKKKWKSNGNNEFKQCVCNWLLFLLHEWMNKPQQLEKQQPNSKAIVNKVLLSGH